ncbi:hypothetical protein OHB13_11740 [Streptomyces sp. NBC_00440]|uniref:hypothetical protein n=1 Tax=Streptomyces sp. NBC_00440 TaxID=2975741 RepID=UPI002E2009E7
MTSEKRIEELVTKWLTRHRDIKAVSARIDEDDWELRPASTGRCDTCASSTTYMELTIWYTLRDGYGGYVEVQTDPLSFLVELLNLEDEEH